MNKTETGGQAFPVYSPDCGTNLGITLRDYFAAKALPGLLAHPASDSHGERELATQAYHLADAMLEARK